MTRSSYLILLCILAFLQCTTPKDEIIVPDNNTNNTAKDGLIAFAIGSATPQPQNKPAIVHKLFLNDVIKGTLENRAVNMYNFHCTAQIENIIKLSLAPGSYTYRWETWMGTTQLSKSNDIPITIETGRCVTKVY
jgi:hypothetical protein